MFGLGLAEYQHQVSPKCEILIDHGQTSHEVLALAHGLGVSDPVRACSGGFDNATSIDGPNSAIRIRGAGMAALNKLGCAVRPSTDTSNTGWVKFAHDDFGNHDQITGYYSPEGAHCYANGTNSILTAKDTMGADEIYIVFYDH